MTRTQGQAIMALSASLISTEYNLKRPDRTDNQRISLALEELEIAGRLLEKIADTLRK